VHARVRGAGYAANDPELLLWVHATFVDSLLWVGEHLYGSLSASDLSDYYRHAVIVGEVFGCPAAEQPATIEEFRSYVTATVDSLTVSEVGRELARAVFWPSVPASRAAIVKVYRVACFGSLPPHLREQFGYRWEGPERWWFSAGGILAPIVSPLTDRAFFAVADGNGRGIAAALALAGIRSAGR
jgi:uncharacterized protein (DUF2236 family)